MIILAGLLLVASTAHGKFVHPLDFKGTELEKKEVIKYIEENVKSTYSKIGMDNPSTLRMMEQENLDCFKKLTKATDRKLLDKVIKIYCNIGMCNYSTILMMYNEEDEASKKKLEF